jgi:hypothetical protein
VRPRSLQRAHHARVLDRRGINTRSVIQSFAAPATGFLIRSPRSDRAGDAGGQHQLDRRPRDAYELTPKHLEILTPVRDHDSCCKMLPRQPMAPAASANSAALPPAPPSFRHFDAGMTVSRCAAHLSPARILRNRDRNKRCQRECKGSGGWRHDCTADRPNAPPTPNCAPAQASISA